MKPRGKQVVVSPEELEMIIEMKKTIPHDKFQELREGLCW
jgi:hypothetical protein